LAEWHYYKAKESYGKDEAGYAASNLKAAASHLQLAASSSHYEFGPDTVGMFESIRKNGKMISDYKKIDNNLLGKDLDGVEKAVKEMGDVLKTTAK